MRRVAAIVLAALSPCAGASVIRHDVSDTLYTNLAGSPAFASAGNFTFNGSLSSCVLLNPWYVITAAHAVTNSGGQIDIDPASTTVRVGTQTRTVTRVIINPAWTGGNYLAGVDLALLQLSEPITGVAAPVIHAGTGLGMIGTYVGDGATGPGTLGHLFPAGTRRAFTNAIDLLADQYAPGIASANLALADFDSPVDAARSFLGDATPTALEGNIAPGDSGGGTFVLVNNHYELFGIHSFSFTDSVVIPTGPSGYGSGTADVRLAPHLPWIQTNIPAPGAGMMLMPLMISARRKRRPA